MPEADGRDGLARALARVGALHVHLDLDVLDRDRVGPANEFASAGGLSAERLVACVEAVAAVAPVAAVTVASYDPALDGEHTVRDAAVEAVLALAA